MKILVTGATGGVGELVVRALAERGHEVVAHGRARAGVDVVVHNADGHVTPAVADLSSLADVAKLARSREVAGIDVLVNNAGVGFGKERSARETSKDGFELRFAVNYLAAFLLSEIVQPKKAIVNVASIGQAALDESDLMSEKSYEGVLAYRRSKLAMVADTFYRARHDPSRAYLTLHPGTFLATKMVIEAGITPLGKAEDGAKSVVAAVERAIAGESGLYFDQLSPTRANVAAYDEAMQDRMHARTLEILRPYL